MDSSMDKSDMLNDLFSICFNNQVPPLVPEDFNSIPSDPYVCTQDLLFTVEEVADILSLGKLDFQSYWTRQISANAYMLKATAQYCTNS